MSCVSLKCSYLPPSFAAFRLSGQSFQPGMVIDQARLIEVTSVTYPSIVVSRGVPLVVRVFCVSPQVCLINVPVELITTQDHADIFPPLQISCWWSAWQYPSFLFKSRSPFYALALCTNAVSILLTILFLLHSLLHSLLLHFKWSSPAIILCGHSRNVISGDNVELGEELWVTTCLYCVLWLAHCLWHQYNMPGWQMLAYVQHKQIVCTTIQKSAINLHYNNCNDDDMVSVFDLADVALWGRIHDVLYPSS